MHRKLVRDLGKISALAAGIGLGGLWAAPRPVHACGGLFCSSANPVNQAAEQIIFADNPDGTVTAVIQILYEGPAERFAWVLPVPGVPDVAVSSDQALDALKQVTNPIYRLNTVFEGSCGTFAGAAGTGAFGAPASPEPSDGGGVTVQASGAVGPYDWEVIAVDPTLEDPADAAIEWLGDNGYDVGALGPDVLRPYLADGLNLIAFRLQKGNTSGSIRPVMMTYESALPSIPIRPTAVAANDDMGVLVFTLSDARAIPANYKGLELNEALIDWFNPNNNYNEVVSRAADEAGGQGFVTEYADSVQELFNTGFSLFPQWQEQTWLDFSSRVHTDPVQMVQEATANWGGWDGFDDALRDAVTLPDAIAFDDFKRCMRCYIEQQDVSFDTTRFLTGLYEWVIKPMIDTQELLESRPYITRLYTTLSAAEMTLDPVFDFNADLADVSNIHVANRVIDCEDSPNPFGDAPWSVQLPQGVTVKGDRVGVWPIEIDSMPAALKILQFGTEGPGRVIEDRSRDVESMMGGEPVGGEPSSGADAGVRPPPSGGNAAPSGDNPPRGRDAVDVSESSGSGGGCSTSSGRPSGPLSMIALALLSLVRRRRRA